MPRALRRHPGITTAMSEAVVQADPDRQPPLCTPACQSTEPSAATGSGSEPIAQFIVTLIEACYELAYAGPGPGRS
jgi:hypothetical protein